MSDDNDSPDLGVSPSAPLQDNDPRDPAAVWLHELWDDGGVHAWSTPTCVHVCDTNDGPTNAVVRLAAVAMNAEDQTLVESFFRERRAKIEHEDDGTAFDRFADALTAWGVLLERPMLIVIDRGGGHLGGVWRCDRSLAGDEQTYERVGRREAQRTFRSDGLMVVVDRHTLKTVVLMKHPDAIAADASRSTVRLDARLRVAFAKRFLGQDAAEAVEAPKAVETPEAVVAVVAVVAVEDALARELARAEAALSDPARW